MMPLSGQQEAEAVEPNRPLLTVNNIEVIYDHVILVLRGVSLEVPEGGIVALLGANGAGKTTTLKAISNLLGAERGEVTKGSIDCMGERIDRLSPNELVRRGVIQVMEGRHCFEHLTVEENLLTGAYTRRDGRAAIDLSLEKVYHYFPRLKERRTVVALLRETPFHLGHIKIMEQATLNGAIVMPPVPAFYHRPTTIDGIVNQTVGRALDLFDLDVNLVALVYRTIWY